MVADLAVVITTHNRPTALRRAVRSLMAQTVLPREVIIVDDASCDPVDFSVFDIFPEAVSCRILRNDSSKGANFSRNLGIKNCDCELVSFLDDDDEFCSDKIESMVAAYTEYGSELITSHARVNFCPAYGYYFVRPADGVSLSKQLISNKVGTTSMVTVVRKFFLSIGGFTEDMPARQDYEAWLKCINAGARVSCVPKVLTVINVEFNGGSISKSVENNEKGMALIEKRYSAQLSTLGNCEQKERRVANERFFCHKYFIGAGKIAASRRAMRGYLSTGALSFLILGFAFLLGRRAVATMLRLRAGS